jgi:hypothetical protein
MECYCKKVSTFLNDGYDLGVNRGPHNSTLWFRFYAFAKISLLSIFTTRQNNVSAGWLHAKHRATE